MRVPEWPLPLWALTRGTARKRIVFEERGQGSRMVPGNARHAGLPGHPAATRSAQPFPGLRFCPISDGRDPLALWDGPPWHPGLEKRRLSRFSGPLPRTGGGGALNLMGLVPQSG